MSLRGRNSASKTLLIACCGLAGLHGYAQDKSPVEFGKVAPADFALPAGVDTAADAVTISDIGIRTFDRPSALSNRFDGYLERTKRILILNRRGFAAASVTIPLIVLKSRDEEITELKGTTYNLDGGKVVKTELDKSSIFKEKLNENLMTERFTFPAVREGSIVEYTYKERSEFGFSNESWQFQDIYPCLWSEYKIVVPSVFHYTVVPRCYLPFCIETQHSESTQVYGIVRTYHWAVKNIPPLKEQPYTTSIRNWLASVEIRPGGGMLFGWGILAMHLLQTDHFGSDLAENNSWMDKDMRDITAGAGSDLDKARKIYAYVRDHFTCNKRQGLVLTNSLKAIYKSRTGSEAELNLLLIAMLMHERLKAAPVLLSTRSNGFVNPMFLQAGVLNYLICKLTNAGVSFFLDASDPDLKYGQLPLECYNGYDVVVDTAVRFPESGLTADSLTEQKKIVVFLSNGEKGGLEGTVQSLPGNAEALAIRKEMKSQDGDTRFRDQLRSSLMVDETVSDVEIDSLRLPDEPLVINYSCHVAMDSTSNLFYFTPMLTDKIAENPLKDVFRVYPVEMPYAKDVNYILTMDVPDGYVVEEMPKSVKVLLNNNGGFFEYILSHDGDQIHFRTRIRLTRANFQPTEYDELRSFFATIVEKESEQIVFKKKK